MNLKQLKNRNEYVGFSASCYFYHDDHTLSFSQDHFQAQAEPMHDNHPLSPMKINTLSNLSI